MVFAEHLRHARALLPLVSRADGPYRLSLGDSKGISYSALAAEVTQWLRTHSVMTVRCGDEHGRGLLSTAAWVAGERLANPVRARCHGVDMTIWLEDR
ncbi:MAG: hypothetical protein M0026_18745 [Nocardiopsaceae bacterium]|nr:hypothetical protein [Nocardiopsaceae bacterium]